MLSNPIAQRFVRQTQTSSGTLVKRFVAVTLIFVAFLFFTLQTSFATSWALTLPLWAAALLPVWMALWTSRFMMNEINSETFQLVKAAPLSRAQIIYGYVWGMLNHYKPFLSLILPLAAALTFALMNGLNWLTHAIGESGPTYLAIPPEGSLVLVLLAVVLLVLLSSVLMMGLIWGAIILAVSLTLWWKNRIAVGTVAVLLLPITLYTFFWLMIGGFEVLSRHEVEIEQFETEYEVGVVNLFVAMVVAVLQLVLLFKLRWWGLLVTPVVMFALIMLPQSMPMEGDTMFYSVTVIWCVYYVDTLLMYLSRWAYR